MSTANIPSECHAWLLSLYEWWVGVAVPRRGGVGGFKQASWVQCSEWGILWAVNQSFIICNCGNVHPGPRVRRLPVGPPFQCSAVMLFNCKHNNNYYYLRQRNRHLQVSTATCCHLTVAGDFFFFFFLSPCCVGKKKTGLQAHTMGRPGAAHVPAGWPRPVPSYSAIVNILGDGGEVSLIVILRGYLYRKHQLEGWWGYNAKAQQSPPKKDLCCHLKLLIAQTQGKNKHTQESNYDKTDMTVRFFIRTG